MWEQMESLQGLIDILIGMNHKCRAHKNRMSRKLIVVGSRVKNQIPRFYGAPYLAVLNRGHTLAKMCMKRAHEMVQKRISSTLHWSIQHIWIREGKMLSG
jgi:hypothetical protein